MAYRLTGIGVGPGDPELLTLKAVDALRDCGAILVPATEKSGSDAGRAETIVTTALPEVADKIIRVPFSMADRTGLTTKRLSSWQASADATVKAFRDGIQRVGFATIGDPSVYSTFSYLVSGVQEQIEDVEVDVIPGITAMQALAAEAKISLVEGDETLALVPLKRGIDELVEVKDAVDTVVVYKAGRHMGELRDHLETVGEDAVAGINVGLPFEQISKVSDLDEAPYFTTVIWPANREGRGKRI